MVVRRAVVEDFRVRNRDGRSGGGVVEGGQAWVVWLKRWARKVEKAPKSAGCSGCCKHSQQVAKACCH